MKLRDYQIDAIKWGLARTKGYFMLNMGMGKTVISLKIIEQLNLPFLVIAPLKASYYTWPGEVKFWLNGWRPVLIHNKSFDLTFKQYYGKTKVIYIVPSNNMDNLYFSVRRFYERHKQFPFAGIIVDEGDEFKNHQSQRFQALSTMMPHVTWRYMLGGTPAPKNYGDLWSQIYLLDKGKRLGKNITAFRKEYMVQDKYNKSIWRFNLSKKQDLFNAIQDLVFRIKDTKTVQTKLHLHWLKIDQTDLDSILANAQSAVQAQQWERQYIQGCLYTDHPRYIETMDVKVQKLIEVSEQYQPSIIFIQFRCELDLIRSHWPEVPAIVGGVKTADVAPIIRKWNQGKLPRLIAHPAAISHSLNLQYGGHNIIWQALTWDLRQYMQANARLARRGQEHTVNIHHILVKDTVDEVVSRALRSKRNVQEALMQYMESKR